MNSACVSAQASRDIHTRARTSTAGGGAMVKLVYGVEVL
jgi:hypothetical protein